MSDRLDMAALLRPYVARACDDLGVGLNFILGRYRTADVVRARRVIVLLLREWRVTTSTPSYPAIALVLRAANPAHSTVISMHQDCSETERRLAAGLAAKWGVERRDEAETRLIVEVTKGASRGE